MLHRPSSLGASRHRSHLLGLLFGLPACVGLLACEEKPAPARETRAPAVAPVDAASAPTLAAEGTAAAPDKVREAEFHVTLSGPQAGKVGEPVGLEVVLEAREGFKVNQEYPLKFQFQKSPAILPEKEVVPKADGTSDLHRVTLPLKVTLATPGHHEVRGKLSFSVCREGDASVCLLEKRELALRIDAS